MSIGIWGWWGIAIMVAMVIGIALYSRRFMHSSADFLSANRVARRYVLNIGGGFMAIVTIAGAWEQNFAAGLSPQWWGKIAMPVSMFIMLTGFVAYRYRQTRALTVAQFFEMRYSRNFRFFAGFLCWLSGLMNYGIFPMITSKFLMCFLGLPAAFDLLGVSVPTFPAIMICYLSVAVFVSCCGGMVSIMLTGFFQNAFAMIVLTMVTVFLACSFSWGDIFAGLQIAPKAGTSMIDPFMRSTTTEFNLTYFLIGVFMAVYGVLAWQGGSGYFSSAKTPHEAVVSGVINSWRYNANAMMLLLLPLLVYSILNLDKFADLAGPIRDAVAALPADSQRNMTVPIGISHLIPNWMVVLFVIAGLCGTLSCDSVYTHSWGTILIQDVIVPLRGRPLEPKTHLLVMRLAIIGVAVFGFFFSILFPLRDYIYLFFSLTAAIYVGGEGAVMIGGLYWKHGTTAGAWTAMVIGTVFGLGGMAVQQVWPYWVWDVFHPENSGAFTGTMAILAGFAVLMFILAIAATYSERFRKGARNLTAAGLITMILVGGFAAAFLWLRNWAGGSPAAWEWLATSEYAGKFIDGQRIMFFAAVAAVFGYVGVSLLGKRKVHDMDKLLHRGRYAVNNDGAEYNARPKKDKVTWGRIVGIGPHFSKFEKILFVASFVWTMSWWFSFALGCVADWCGHQFTDGFWYWYWWTMIYVSLAIGALCTLWVLIGGVFDCRSMMHDLRNAKRDDTDDGFVR
ncbi:MAG: sodium:solute symporter [Victivallaceae bacterium]|nr:hypothetical protein [Victivallaceae bacterium]